MPTQGSISPTSGRPNGPFSLWRRSPGGQDAAPREARCMSRPGPPTIPPLDRKSTRLNSSHGSISYALFCCPAPSTRSFHTRRSSDLKGLDFPNVTVVGVVDADTGLHLPDFRAAERTFQLVAQVAGRAGRGPKGGQVYVQTRAPDHPALRSEEHTSELQSR